MTETGKSRCSEHTQLFSVCEVEERNGLTSGWGIVLRLWTLVVFFNIEDINI
jgi:hypothetical protein